MSAEKKINQKHLGFLLYDAKTMRPALGIELDDKSHNQTKNQERDALVNEVLTAAEAPRLRIRAAKGHHPTDLAAQIQQALSSAPTL